jgi:hypothetical protein
MFSRRTASDPYFSSVSLLLHMDGSNGSTTFTDSSGTPKTVTAYGGAAISTAQSKFGGAGGYFDGSGDYLSTPSSSDFNFGSGDFTVEAWVYLNSVSDDWFVVSSAGTGGFFFGNQPGGGWGVGRTAIAWDHVSGDTASTSTWYHVAASRSGAILRIFVDGTQVGSTFTNSQSYDLSTGGLTVGSQGASFFLNGYIDDLRITKGVARYTATFTPPAAAFPDS